MLPENNSFVENQQHWCFVAPPIIYGIRIIQKPIRCFAQFFDSCFWRIPWEFTEEKHLRLSFSKFPSEKLSKASDMFLDDPDAINDLVALHARCYVYLNYFFIPKVEKKRHSMFGFPAWFSLENTHFQSWSWKKIWFGKINETHFEDFFRFTQVCLKILPVC